MISFITCPVCAGGESVSPKAAKAIADMIDTWLSDIGSSTPTPLDVELSNIRNAILNMRERENTPPGEEPPICPTPKKRKYSNHRHAHPDAVRWRQHAYPCNCGYWHLSKQTPAEHAAKISIPAASADE